MSSPALASLVWMNGSGMLRIFELVPSCHYALKASNIPDLWSLTALIAVLNASHRSLGVSSIPTHRDQDDRNTILMLSSKAARYITKASYLIEAVTIVQFFSVFKNERVRECLYLRRVFLNPLFHNEMPLKRSFLNVIRALLWIELHVNFFELFEGSYYECDAPASVTLVSGGAKAAIPPKTTKQKIAMRNELNAKSTLLLAILDEHLLKFYGIKDEKTLWEAIKTSQLEIHGEVNLQEDANLNLVQIDTDDLEEMNLKWQVAMLTMRVKKFIKKIGRNLNFNGKETTGLDKTKVKCYNCHMRGHFARECRAPRSQGNRNRDNTRRVVPLKTLANALVVTDRMCYDWSYQAGEGPTDFAIKAFLSLGSSTSDTELEESLKEKDNLKLKLEKFETSSRNLTNLINSQSSSKDKTGLGYDSQLNERDLNNKSDVFESASDSCVNESEEDNNQANNRYKASEGYHAVPPPYIGNFMPPRPDLSFAGLADSVFKSAISETITSVHETETSTSKTSKESMEKPKIVRHNDPIIKYWESDSDDECEIRHSIKHNKPSHAKINYVKSDENTRKSVIESHTYKQVENLRNS
nr:hypothetical protein [Tanacetum cinerariifolium]GEW09527.1 hypothetical protein [Tanacetum cinerariifolium]